MFEEVEQILENRPKNMGPMKDYTHYAKITGPCGDTDEIWLRIDAGRIRKASFMTDGCAPSVICCSVAARLSEGLKPDHALSLTALQVLERAGPIPEDHHHCAELALFTLQEALIGGERPEKESWWKRLKARLFRKDR